ncbi:MAG: PH domain-containing protein [Bacteroidaceae bacterium]|nr:PH domain-containing protein [Bacteroidaceae bacterium]
MGNYTKSLTTSNSEKVIIEAKFSKVRYFYTIISYALSLFFFIALLGVRDNYGTNSESIFRATSDEFIYGGIFFMYPFVLGCIKLRDILSQEVALTNKRLIIKTGASDKDTHDLPINIIQTIQIEGMSLSVYSLNGSVVNIHYIKNIQPLREAIQEVLNTKETLSNSELQTQALLGISQLNFKKEKSGCMDEIATWLFWLVLVPLMGAFFGMFIQSI